MEPRPVNSFGLGVLLVLLFALAWGVYVNWRLYAGTHLRCLAFRLGATVVALVGAVAVPSIVFLSYHSSVGLGAEAALPAMRLGYLLAVPFGLIALSLAVAAEWQKLFREFDDCRALLYGGRRGLRLLVRMLTVQLLGRVPRDLVLSHVHSAAPLPRSLVGVLPWAAIVYAWASSPPLTTHPDPHLHSDLHYMVTVWWVLITWAAACALFMLWSALRYSRPRSATGP
jgi:hypothetical protein